MALNPCRHSSTSLWASRAVVVLAELADANLVRRLASSGADTLLSQDASGEVLRRPLESVMLGQTVFPPPPSHSAEGISPHPRAEPIPFPAPPECSLPSPKLKGAREVILSHRESQVLRWLVDGASNKVIAREMQITKTTVKAHIKGCCVKSAPPTGRKPPSGRLRTRCWSWTPQTGRWCWRMPGLLAGMPAFSGAGALTRRAAPGLGCPALQSRNIRSSSR